MACIEGQQGDGCPGKGLRTQRPVDYLVVIDGKADMAGRRLVPERGYRDFRFNQPIDA